MIGQYLSNTNENAIVSISQIILELNKTIVELEPLEELEQQLKIHGTLEALFTWALFSSSAKIFRERKCYSVAKKFRRGTKQGPTKESL